MDYKTFISKMTSGEFVFIVTDSTPYSDFIDNMAAGKVLYFSEGSFYSLILIADPTESAITYTYYDLDGRYTQKTISR